jgi:four helix bundle protein
MQQNKLSEISFRFSVNILQVTDELYKKRKFDLSNQLFRSAASIGANIRESIHSESRADFIHKLKIAAKEAEETKYWIDIIRTANIVSVEEDLLNDLIYIQKMLSKSITTTKANLKKNSH